MSGPASLLEAEPSTIRFEADGYFNWTRPQTRSFIIKYTRQFSAR